MTEKIIESLKARLIMLGFEPDVETMLRCHLCFAPAAFDVRTVRAFGADTCQYSVHIGYPAGGSQLSVQYYQATLRKQLIVPEDLHLLDQKMKLVPWEDIVRGKYSVIAIEKSLLKAAAEVIAEMEGMGSVADLLKYKYWVGTALESQIGGLAALRNEWEISERFYFFDEVSAISFSDALRFLNSKWMERQVSSQKRLLLKKDEPASGGGSRTVKLLVKNARRGGRAAEGGKS
jgi:hypothetical protein